jgi:CDGSH-type Zn-finger protein
MACTCGFSTEFPECNGTHKVVKKVKEQMIKDIEEIGLGEENDQLNALGMKMLILNKIRGNK